MAVLPFIAPVAELASGLLKRILPEKMTELEKATLQQQLTLELLKADWGNVAAQLNINLEEAKSDNIFVSGWRPSIGWVCSTALAYHYILQPIVLFVVAFWNVKLPPLPVFDMATLMPLTMALLGVAGMRTYEKVQGAANAKVGK